VKLHVCEADRDEERPEDPVHVRLEEEGHLGDRQQAADQDCGERRVREGAAQGVEASIVLHVAQRVVAWK
jgi:hypothetical protein